MKKTISVILIFILVITGCSPAGDAGRGTKTVETGSFSLEVPSQARENKSMNEDAAVCYVNLIKGLYTMVIEEDKERFAQMLSDEGLSDYYTPDLAGYNSVVLDAWGNDVDGLDIISDIDSDTLVVNALPRISNTFTIISDGVHFMYDIACIEGKRNYYQLVFFCQENDMTKYSAVREKVLGSFAEK